MSWLNTWSYRKTVTITGQAGAGADYQVDFSIGDAAGGDFNLESHCTSFPNDIEVTDNDQITILDYWVEDLTVDPIRMWVEVADDLGSNVDICVYYGKSGATTQSDGSATFTFFDDFNRANSDTVGYNWVETGTVDGDIVSNELQIYEGTGGGYSSHLNQPYTFDHGVAVRIKSKGPDIIAMSGDRYNFIIVDENNGGVRLWGISYTSAASGNSISMLYSGSGWADEAIDPYVVDQWYEFEFQYNNSARTCNFVIDGTSYAATKAGWTDSNWNTYANKITLGGESAPTINWYNDNCIARKWQATEPAFSSAGAEESAPTAGQISTISSPPIALFGGF